MNKLPSKKYFQPDHGYGWTTLSPDNFIDRMKQMAVFLDKLQETNPFQAIAFCGSSGSAAAFILGVALKLPVIYIRKENEDSHGVPVESNSRVEIKSYIIVDDFSSTGRTIRHIIKMIKRTSKLYGQKEPVCIGACFYDTNISHYDIILDDKSILPIFRLPR